MSHPPQPYAVDPKQPLLSPQYQQQQGPYQGQQQGQYQYQAQPTDAYYNAGGAAPPHAPPPATHQDQEKFVVDKVYRDKWWAVLFIVHLLGLIAMAATYYSDAEFESSDDGDDADYDISTDDLQTVGTFVVVACATAGVFAAFWLWIMQRYAESLIWFTLIFSIVMLAVSVLGALVAGQAVLAIILLVFLAFNCLYVYMVRHRIPFSTALLQGVVDCVRSYPAMVTAAFLFLVIQFVWLCMWGFTVAVVYAAGNYEEEVDGNNSALGVFLLLSLFWTSQVINNVLHVTVAGTVATWYFQAGDSENPTWKSLKRACTTSFGSICLGSLIVAIIKTMRALAESAKQQAQRDNNGAMVFLLCCVECCLRWLDSLVQYFNAYAYAQIAIYGKSFVEAAKDTWRMIKSKGIEALINDSLIDGVLIMGAFVGGVVTAAVCGFFYYSSHSDSGDDWIAFAVLGFFFGFIIVILVMGVVQSGVIAIFVCYAEDPEALSRSNPPLYESMTSAYYQLQSRV